MAKNTTNAELWPKLDVEKATAFLEDVQYYVDDTSTLTVGRGKWRRPKKSEAAQFLRTVEQPADKLSYFDRAAPYVFSAFSAAPLALDAPLHSPQEESLLPPPWPEHQGDEEPLNIGFLIATDAPLKTRQQYDLYVRKLLWDLNVPIVPHIATTEDEHGNRIIIVYLPTSQTNTLREIYKTDKPLAEERLDEFIADIAQAMKLVEDVHRHRLLLRSIRPDIFMSYPSDGVKKLVLGGTDGLIRLGAAMIGGIASEDASDSWLVEECAPYLAPEFLGRSSRKVSYRSDVYSFGISMYELITGHLPAAGSDFLHKVHAILALEPPPLLQMAPHAPFVLAQIVTKMIDKDPAKRYISMRSARYDLEQLQELRRGKRNSFTVGEMDQLARLEFPEGLVGLDHQISVIKNAYRQAEAGEYCSLSVRGASGTGKTSVAMQTIQSCGGVVFYGKYDMAEHNAFLAPIKTILNTLLTPLVSLKEEEFDVWRHRLVEAIGQPLVPFFLILLDSGLRQSLRLVQESESIPSPSRVKEFLPPSFRSATYSSIIRVIALFAECNGQDHSRLRYRPLVLLVDDIQWATPDDMLFYEQLMQPAQPGGVLVILAFRDNEGSERFLQSPFRKTVCELPFNVETSLLDQDEVLALLSGVLLLSPEEPTDKIKELSRVIHQQTLGNGSHIRNLFSDLYSQEMLFFNWDALEWDWHHDKGTRFRPSTTLGAAEVLEAMLRAGTERGKTADTLRRIVFAASALASHGGSFSCKMVAMATNEPVQDVVAIVKSLADNSRIFDCSGTAPLGLRTPTMALIQSQDEALIDRWNFVHDSVQQAAISLLGDQARTHKHRLIGKRLLNSSEKDDPLVAEIALYNLNQAYLRGYELLADEASELVSLNLLSAQSALHHGASEIASRHADLAYRVWKGSRTGEVSPPLAILLTLTDCCTFAGEYERAAAYGEAAVSAATQSEERLLAAYSHVKAILNANDSTALQLRMCISTSEYLNVMTDTGQLHAVYGYLNSYAGIDVTPNKERNVWLIDWLKEWTPPQGEPILSRDKIHINKTTLMNSGIALAFTSDPISGVQYICESAYLNLHTSTFTSHTALALNVLVLYLNGIGEYAVAQKFTDFNKRLLPQLPCSPHQAVEVEAGFAANWYDDETCAKMGKRLAETGHKAAAIGHSEFAAYSFGTGGYLLLFAGARSPAENSDSISHFLQRISPSMSVLARRPVEATQLLSSAAPNVNLLEVPDDIGAQTMQTQQYYCIKLWLGLLLDQIDAETLLAAFSVKNVAAGNSPWQSLRFLYAVTIYDLARVSRLPDVKMHTHLASSFIEGWERTAATLPKCPNFRGPLCLMKAAKDEYMGRFQSSLEGIDAAIDTMVGMPSLMLAHANERICGSKRAAAPYLAAARSIYEIWNIPHKVKTLGEQLSQVTTGLSHPHLSESSTTSVHSSAPVNPSPAVKSSETRSSSSGSDRNAFGELVDLSSLVAVVTAWQSAKSAQAVSRSLVEILLKSLGCRYGALALKNKDKVFRLAAFGDANFVKTDVNTSIENVGEQAPAAIMMQVAKLQKPLNDIAMVDSNPVLRDDPYIRKHHPRSIIALPVYEGTNFCAIAYFDCVRENAFTSSKTSEIISLLSVGAVTAMARIGLLEELDREKANLENTVRSRSATAEALAARASHAQQAQSRFLLTMSHELRSPLNSVIVLSDLLLEANLEPALWDYVKTIKESSNDLLSVIRDILDYSRLESDQVKLEKISFDLPDLLDGTLDQLSETAANKGIELVNATAFDVTPPIIIADSTRIKQCILNLVGNALKFTPNGGAVSVIASSEPLTPLSQSAPARLRVQLAVTGRFHRQENRVSAEAAPDNGIGVAPQKQALLFRSFSQIDDSITRLYGGSGLGLAIVRQLALLMSGDAWCVSELGKGSTFFFSFEAELSNTESISHTADVLPAKNIFEGKKAAILSPASLGETRKVLHNNLAFLGFKVNVWSNNEPPDQEAVDLDLLVFVAAMPPLMTATRIKRLSALNPKCRFIILSNKKQLNDPLFTDPAGAAPAILSLPIRHRQLAITLTRLFQKPHLLQEELPKPKAPAKLLIPRLAETCPFTILCVDDNAVNIKVLGQLLTRLGYKDFGIASDGQEAIEATRTRSFDLVLMDLQMPKCDGNTAMRTIKAEQPAGPLIVAVTAHAHSGAQEAAIASGFDAYISKPIILHTLLSVFREMYARRSPDYHNSN